MALCCLRAEPCEAFRALELCEEVLDTEPDNAKAVYRKGKALVELGEIKEAEWELVRACKLMPKDAAVRKDLEQLRSRMREAKAKEKASFEGLFDKRPGFASDERSSAAAAAPSKLSDKDIDDMYFHADKENPYEESANPHEEARALQASGQCENAVLAWEVAMERSRIGKDWAAHFGYCLEFGTLFMDINMDRLALHCFNKILEPPTSDDSDNRSPPPAALRQQALLLKAICLLNEAEGDPKEEVTDCLSTWMCEVRGRGPQDRSRLDAEMLEWRGAEGGGASADISVALGLLCLVQGKDSAKVFAAALQAPEDDGSCFGSACRRASKWNMLGAVLANRNSHQNALVAYEQALEARPHYPRALINRGISHSAAGDHLGAVRAYAAALAIVPTWCTEQLWQLLGAAAKDSSNDELGEAARAKNLTSVLGALPPPASSAVEVQPAVSVLQRIGLVD